ncbi:MAG: tetratricopeptide repeat protein [Myxococcota bacterium]|nr:tetratricopeptide repeat protein [Myxococcota bacterium]
MAASEQQRNALFSLRLEQGVGRLVLSERRIADLLVIDEMRLSLAELPSRLDMTGGVERFRHQRTRVERLVVHIDDHDLSRCLDRYLDDEQLTNLEARALDGDLIVIGEAGQRQTPFLLRMRLETGTVGAKRAALLSVYEARTYGPSDLAAPQMAGRFLNALGFEHENNGPTVISFDPIVAILDEVSAELGWKLPDHSDLKIAEIESSAGQIRLVCDMQRPIQVGPRRLETSFENSAKVRRFMADYEAKQLYQNTEALIDEGRIERAIRHYDRQSELHPDNAFLANRLMQLQVMSVDTLADAADTASRRLARYPEDTDALLTLSNVHWQRGQIDRAADLLDRVADAAERRADLLEAAQARCALAIVLSDSDPDRALDALKSALSLRRGLVAARKRLSELQAQAGDWVAALKTRESILASESNAERRCDLLIELGHLALSNANDTYAALGFFERALVEMPGRISALLGLATAQEQNDDFLSAVRTLDRASRLLQERGQNVEAADVIVRLGHLWTKEPGDGITTASLRFRQALMLVPGHPGALYGLADVAVVEGDYGRARSALEELLRSVDEGRVDIEKDRLYLRLGQILQTLGEESRLAVVYFQKATDGPWSVAKPAFEALEDIHSKAESFGDVARVLERSLLRSEDDDDRVARLCRLTTIVSERHGDPTRAIELLEAAVSSLPQQRDLLNPLAALYRHAADTEKLANILGRLAELNTDPDVLVEIYLEQAGLLATQLNQVDLAVEAYAKALGCDPANLVALDGLIDITRERERFGELAALLDRRSVLSDGSEASRLRFELAQIYARQLKRPDAAIEQLKRAKENDSTETHVLRLLGDLYFEADRLDLALVEYETLKSIYETDGYDEPVPGFLMRIAEVFDGLNRFSESLETIKAAIERDPERIQTYVRGQELVLNAGQLSDVLAVLRYGLDRAGQPKARTYLCVRLGRLLWRELRKPDEARTLLSEAAMYESEDRDVRRMRIEIATALGDWTEVAELLKVQLDTAQVNERPAILVSLAKLAYDELNRPDEGLQFAQAALAEVDDYIPALTLLADKSFTAENWLVAQKALSKLLQLEGVHARPDDRFRLALTQLELGQESLSYDGLRALRNEGSYIPGLSIAMARACVVLGHGRVLATLIDELLDEAEVEDAQLLRDAAKTLRAESDNEGLARRCIDAASAFDGLPGDDFDSVGQGVRDGNMRATMPLPVIDETQLEVGRLDVDSTPDANRVNQDVLTTREVGSLDRAGVSMDEAYEETLASLSDTYAADDDELPPLATRRLPTEEEIQNPADAAAQLRARADELGDTPNAAPIWLQLAELIRDRMHDPDGAVPCFERVLELAGPTSSEWLESVEALEDLFAIRENWSSLLRLYDIRLANQPENAASIHLLRASVLNTHGRLEEASEAAEKALSLGDRARELLIGILEKQGDSERIEDLLLSDLDDLGKADRGYRYWRAADVAQKTHEGRALTYLSQAAKLLSDTELATQFLNLARQMDDAELLVDALFYQATNWASRPRPPFGVQACSLRLPKC